MARTFLILKNSPSIDWIFLENQQKSTNNSGIISYRHIICQALHQIRATADIKETFERFKDAFDREKEYTTDNFFELYFFKSNRDSNVALVIDRTQGIYPLVLDKHNHRYEAFKNALQNIHNKYEDIITVLKTQDEWTENLQTELEKHYDN